jgi:hypothetical protein
MDEQNILISDSAYYYNGQQILTTLQRVKTMRQHFRPQLLARYNKRVTDIMESKATF